MNYGSAVLGDLALFEDEACDYLVAQGVPRSDAERMAEKLGRIADRHAPAGVL